MAGTPATPAHPPHVWRAGEASAVAAARAARRGGSASALLEITGLHKAYDRRVVLAGLDLRVDAGEIVALLGANGSGKSTALRCVVGLTRPDGGSIALAGDRASMVFQDHHLVRRRSALDNVCAGALGRLTLRRSFHPLAFPAVLREEAMGCLARVGLADRATDRVSRLSGGQRQRVAIARALCQRARVMLADEPVSALDPSAAEQVLRILVSLAHDDGLAVAAVLHQPDLARRHADRIVGLRDGRVAFDAPPGDVDDDEVAALYTPTGA